MGQQHSLVNPQPMTSNCKNLCVEVVGGSSTSIIITTSTNCKDWYRYEQMNACKTYLIYILSVHVYIYIIY